MMRFIIVSLFAVALGQKTPTLADLDDIASAAQSAASAYAAAAGSSNGCVRDASGNCSSFLAQNDAAEGTSFVRFSSVVRPLIAKIMGETGQSPELERTSQSPLVFLHLHQ